jgi:hypothetical protein
MKRNKLFLSSSIVAMAAILLFVFNAKAQEPFQVKWTMDYTQAGVSDHANFTPSASILAGGANTFTLPTVYSGSGGAVVVGYVIRPWPVAFSASRYMEFTFTANSFKYNITSISFRLRRSGNGPNSIKVRTSLDAFAADLNAYVIGNLNIFNSYTIPVSFNNLSNNTITLRIYAYNAVDIFGTLWFDEIAINGDVLAIILPVDITWFKGNVENGQVALSWETARERNSKEFVIERSADAKTFTTIGKLMASGETSERTQYTYIDNYPAAGISYYRLKLVDKNEGFTITKAISIQNPEYNSAVKVAPNPSSPECIHITGSAGLDQGFALHTGSGLAVPFRTENLPDGSVRIYPCFPLNSGIYFVTYVKNGRKEHLKVLVP